MIVAEACPRCRGTLTRVRDIGDTYHSCVQCGHIVYGPLPAVTVLNRPEEREWPKATDRSDIRRRQIRRAKATAQGRQAA